MRRDGPRTRCRLAMAAIVDAKQERPLEPSGDGVGNAGSRRARWPRARGEVLFHMGDIEGSLRNLQAGITLYETAARHSMSTQIPQVACLCYAAWALAHLGRSEECLQRSREAQALAGRLSHPLSVALSAALISELHQFRLEIAPCRASAERAIALSREQRFPFWEGTATILLGWAVAMGGEFERGRRTMQDGLSIFAGTGARVQHTSWLGMLAEVHHAAGRHAEGLALLEQAMSFVESTGERYYLSELHRVEGELRSGLGEGDADAAAAAYGRAIAVAREQGSVMRELRAAVSLARLLRRRGRIGEARAVLKARRALIGPGRDGIDVDQARALLSGRCGKSRRARRVLSARDP